MRQEVHQHPDGIIYVRTSNGTYQDTMENFVKDSGGKTLPPLPEGADDRVYTQGVRHAIMGDGNVIEGGPVPWDLGDELIASVTDLLSRQAIRRQRA